jgi:hypothetical protein
MASSESVQGFIKRQTLKQPKLVYVDKVVHKYKENLLCLTDSKWLFNDPQAKWDILH